MVTQIGFSGSIPWKYIFNVLFDTMINYRRIRSLKYPNGQK
jgi:hypothetical protein